MMFVFIASVKKRGESSTTMRPIVRLWARRRLRAPSSGRYLSRRMAFSTRPRRAGHHFEPAVDDLRRGRHRHARGRSYVRERRPTLHSRDVRTASCRLAQPALPLTGAIRRFVSACADFQATETLESGLRRANRRIELPAKSRSRIPPPPRMPARIRRPSGSAHGFSSPGRDLSTAKDASDPARPARRSA